MREWRAFRIGDMLRYRLVWAGRDIDGTGRVTDVDFHLDTGEPAYRLDVGRDGSVWVQHRHVEWAGEGLRLVT